MKFTPMDEKTAEAREFGLLPDGDYDYEVSAAEDCVSQAGNDQIKLELTVFDGESRHKVWDYLVASDKAAWKIRQFAASCGMLERYECGELEAGNCEGRSGRVSIWTQESKGYAPQNKVKAYLKDKRHATPRSGSLRAKAPAGDGVSILDDEAPFSPCWQ